MTDRAPPPAQPAPPVPLYGLVALCGLLLLFIALTVEKLWSVDTWTLLSTGRWIVTHHALPQTDQFSYTVRDHEWVEPRWLFCLLLYGGWRLGGPALPILVASALIAIAFTVIIWPVRRTAARPIGMAVVAIGLCAGAARWVVRPELMTYFFIPIYLVLLEGFMDGRHRRLAWILPLVQIIWTSSHTLFIFGPVLAWAIVGCETIQRIVVPSGDTALPGTSRPSTPIFDKPALLLALAITAACWINPYFHRGAIFPLLLYREMQPGNLLGRHIDEFHTPLRHSIWLWSWDMWVAGGFAFVGILSFIVNFRLMRLSRLAIFAAGVYVALLGQRNVAIFAIFATWAVLRNLHEVLGAPRRAAGLVTNASHVALGALCTLAAWYLATDRYMIRMGAPREFGLGVVEWNTPSGAADFLMRAPCSKQIFASMADGDYLNWATQGQYPVFVDGRLEVYGADFLGQFFEMNAKTWPALVDRWGINTAIVQHANFGWLVDLLRKDPHWALVYLDERDHVFVRDVPANAGVIDRCRIDPTRPWEAHPPADQLGNSGGLLAVQTRPWYFRGMAESFAALRAMDNAVRFIEAGLEKYPGDISLRLLLAYAFRQTGRLDEAARLQADLAGASASTIDGDIILSEAFIRKEKRAEAIAPLKRAVAARPDDANLRALLADQYMALKDYANARTTYNEALRRDPHDPPRWINLGLACEALADTTGAIVAYEGCLREDPSRFAVHNQLGILYAKSGNAVAAERCFAEAIRLKPDYQSAINNLNFLKSAAASRPATKL